MKDKLLRTYSGKFISFHNKNVQVKEIDKGATINKIEISNADFISFNTAIIEKLNELYEGKSLCRTCDGILKFRYKNQKYLFFIELKSSFKRDNIIKAFNQLECSYTKISSILDIINEFDINNYKLGGLIITTEASTREKSYIKKNSYTGGVYQKLCYNLCFGENKAIIKSDTFFLKDESLKEKCKLQTNMPVYFVKYEKDLNIDITKYLN